MAQEFAMSISVFIIDTSYLLELFKVPGHSNVQSNREVKERFENAVKNNSRLYVPLPCIYELANHIAHVDDGNERQRLANVLYETIESSIQDGIPWNITPSTGLEELPKIFQIFASEYVLQKISMTDTSIIQEAERLKKKYKGSDFRVHIWTKEISIKAYEPDKEANPFFGR